MPYNEITVSFAGDSKNIHVSLDPFTIIADGGDRTEPSPGALFIAGVAACTASTARGYCVNNELPLPTGMKAVVEIDETSRLIDVVEMQLLVPPEFPPERLEALQKAAGKCTVKKWWQNPPEFILRVSQPALEG